LRPARARVRFGAAAALLAAPTVLAFFTGGYFDAGRDGAGIGVSALAAIALIVERPRWSGSRGGRLALLAAGMFSAWTMVSIIWAPIAGTAYSAGGLAILYFVALVTASLLLRGRVAQVMLEPALALGAAIVIGYGLAGRLLPGILHFARSVSADGRLEQPLTYWNAMGELAAIGLVLSARLAGDARRPRSLRAVAAAAAAPLGMGLYASFSRGALFACVAGLLTLVVAAPSREGRRGLIVTLVVAILAAVAVAPLDGVASLSGSLAHREHQGALALAVLVLLSCAAAAGMWRISGRPAPGSLRLPRHSGWIAVALVCAGLALAIVVGAKETSGVPITGGAGRLTSVQSNRYDYWDVALKAFAHDPPIGVGAGGWAVWWLRDRPYADGATDTHSLELQTLAELGLVGAALLAMLFVGTGLAARAARRIDPAAAAGPLAGVVVWLAHSPLDWDWQMPALTLSAVLLAGGLVAIAESGAPASPAAPAALGPDGRDRDATRPAVAGVARCASVLAALVVCAWFALGLRQANSLTRAQGITGETSAPLTAAQARRAQAALNEAGTLNPDRAVALDRALLRLEEGRPRAARTIALAVTRAEPENIRAWVRLAQTAAGDPALYRRALIHAHRLEPLSP
jgi:hypothetical protein